MNAGNVARSPGPTPVKLRHVGIDAVRGLAVLGLIVAHITLFAHPVDGLSFTWTTLPYEGLTRTYFQFAFLFVFGKASFLFALLFGASVVLFSRNADAEGRLWYRRMRWLMLFGLLHGVLLFHGDVLFPYAVCGLLVLWRVRDRGARWLATAGAAVYLTGTLLLVGAMMLGSGADGPPEFFGAGRQADAFGGSFRSGATYRAVLLLANLPNLPFVLLPIAGVMLVGMSVMKSGLLAGERREGYYLRSCVVGLGLGLPLGAAVYGWATADATDPSRVGVWMGVHQVVGIPTAVGYLSGVIYLVKRRLLTPLTHGLACVGRMALTNYLLQSAIAGFIFYGWGLGLYGSLGMAELVSIVIAIVTANIALSVLWLGRFRFGPMEWLWRRATYRERRAENVRR